MIIQIRIIIAAAVIPVIIDVAVKKTNCEQLFDKSKFNNILRSNKINSVEVATDDY